MYNNYERVIEEICKKDYRFFMEKENVVGVAKGYQEIAGEFTQEMVLKVLVTEKVPSKELDKKDIVPRVYKGVKTDVTAVGEIKALELEAPALDERVRPAMPGYSVGEINVTAGTITTIVFDGEGLETRAYVLSNNHILANENRAPIGSPIVQPGPADGGTAPIDVIASLTDFIPVLFSRRDRMPENVVDCAIAETSSAISNRLVYYQGFMEKATEIYKIGDRVYKTGRTTGYTSGLITMTNVTIMVQYNTGEALFVNQIMTESISRPGDSGSLLINENGEAVGLLFAGSTFATIYNPFTAVLEMLEIRLR